MQILTMIFGLMQIEKEMEMEMEMIIMEKGWILC
jgi:hypothetical protein